MAEYDNTLGTDMSLEEKKRAYDAAFRRLLSNKQILAWILHDCLDEYKDCAVSEIADRYIESEPEVTAVGVHPHSGETITGIRSEDKLLNEGAVYYDIRFFASAPGTDEMIKLIINIEAQQDYYPGYPLVKRGIYYCGRMLSAQYGTEFTESEYGNLKKVCSIWICSNPPKERANTITRYNLHEENIVGSVSEKREIYDMLSVVMVCLGGSYRETRGALRMLALTMTDELATQEKRKQLSDEFGLQMTKHIESEVSIMCNVSEGIYRRGIEKGIEQGLAQGLAEGQNRIIQRMLNKGAFSYDEIADIAGVSVSFVKQLDEQRKKEQ